jgi:hypothetical protein
LTIFANEFKSIQIPKSYAKFFACTGISILLIFSFLSYIPYTVSIVSGQEPTLLNQALNPFYNREKVGGYGNLQLATLNGTLVQVWDQASPQTNKADIYFKATYNNGSSTNNTKISNYTNTIRYSDSDLVATSPQISLYPQIAVSNNTIWIAWQSLLPDNELGAIIETHSNDSGETFSEPVIISTHPGKYYAEPQIIVDPATGEVFYAFLNSLGAEDTCRHRC